MYPIIPDFRKYPDTGRSLRYTSGEIGLAGHWIKHFLHHAFLFAILNIKMLRMVRKH